MDHISYHEIICPHPELHFLVILSKTKIASLMPPFFVSVCISHCV